MDMQFIKNTILGQLSDLLDIGVALCSMDTLEIFYKNEIFKQWITPEICEAKLKLKRIKKRVLKYNTHSIVLDLDETLLKADFLLIQKEEFSVILITVKDISREKVLTKMVDSYVKLAEQHKKDLQKANNSLEALTQQQEQTIMEMSTSVVELWKGIFFLPLIGRLRGPLIASITASILQEIAKHQASVFILDIHDLKALNAETFQFIFKIQKATSLMGCTCILSGVLPNSASYIIDKGINIENILISMNIKGALQKALFITQKQAGRNFRKF